VSSHSSSRQVEQVKQVKQVEQVGVPVLSVFSSVPHSPRSFPFARVAQALWHVLPAETQEHARAAVTEAAAAARSLADGTSDGVEAAIDRISLVLGGKSL